MKSRYKDTVAFKVFFEVVEFLLYFPLKTHIHLSLLFMFHLPEIGDNITTFDFFRKLDEVGNIGFKGFPT